MTLGADRVHDGPVAPRLTMIVALVSLTDTALIVMPERRSVKVLPTSRHESVLMGCGVSGDMSRRRELFPEAPMCTKTPEQSPADTTVVPSSTEMGVLGCFVTAKANPE